MLAGLTAFVVPAWAHRLDEYLQATVIDVSRQEIDVALRLTPGVDVASQVLHQIDTDGGGGLSAQEQQKYAQYAISQLSLTLDGTSLSIKLKDYVFPSVEELRAGSGTISLHLRAQAVLKPGRHKLRYSNQGSGADTVYLVNALLPHDHTIHIQSQKRSPNQAVYDLDFTVDQ
ncbi:hypothetical protein BJI49_09535 [Acetobacter pasteurianus]|uniref:Uncharacterized protein n=1 Tax=Acetobacter pasteurianus TaxID=438 RepID=A0A1A0D9U6_ACEPA|nr:hypothetical protein [Acetobacter pasteurianus]OAZ72058.1 hypothetical protein SRCM100623_01985 [Acetobacter pasteurianus]RCL05899.1 hypothetical protein BJI49_09535 [Acetobacter pasteurianus]GAB31424.1 hypothetical protein APS_2026 [Acetobacter pasteurianus subsp. pasteurianus LMG 1262 = NBRC 106471]GCD49831.1 hypothetical protein NBRC106471_1387 [Acetobacter pasteurianus subsp. pasteurianus LMG 1262 = NBRC 106471]